MRKRAVLNTLVTLALCVPAFGSGQPDAGFVDARRNFPPTAARVGHRVVPHLGLLRAGFAETPPVPGGLGAGTVYRQGALQITTRAELFTQMIVHPNGIDVPNWIFTTATNRTELTVEVVGIYIGASAALGIFDWSCRPGYPCLNGESGPSWQWTRDFTDLSCYYQPGDDGGGHLHDLLSYRNRSQRRGADVAPPPPIENWKNSVLLFNYCTGLWELVYSHDFRAEQRDCSADQFACGWWGPIIETFNETPQPPIKELGFLGSALRHDNAVSALGVADTFFSFPNTPWVLFHIDPNRSWGVGSNTGNTAAQN
jgi:hypothetical protein